MGQILGGNLFTNFVFLVFPLPVLDFKLCEARCEITIGKKISTEILTKIKGPVPCDWISNPSSSSHSNTTWSANSSALVSNRATALE